MDFVLDGSTALRWCFTTQQTAVSKTILRRMTAAKALVPAVWPLEIANAISREINKRSISNEDAGQFFTMLSTFEIVVAPGGIDARLLFDAARRHQLSSYDASYVELALEHNLHLVTEDDKMTTAASRAGVKLLL